MAIDFTENEFEMMGRFLWTEVADLESLDQAYAQTVKARDILQVEHDIYSKFKQDALDTQDALLQAKADELDRLNPAFVHSIHYLTQHPVHAGADPTKWEIIHVDELLVTVIDRDHDDATPLILATEAQWLVFHDLHVSEFYGTAPRLQTLIDTVTGIVAKRQAIISRNVYVRAIL